MVASTLRNRMEPGVSPRRCFERTKPTLRRGTRDPTRGDYRSVPDRAQCASITGLQLDFPAQQIQGVAEVWVPFDEVIAVGWS
jgi:hypothetical protein